MRGFEGQFKHINRHGTDLLRAFYEDEEFLRYCKILNDDPINTVVDVNSLKVDLISSRGVKGLIELSTIPEIISTEGKVRIYFAPAHGNPKSDIDNVEYYYMGIVIPNDYSILYGLGQWRSICIAERIAKFIDNKPVTGLGNPKMVNWERVRIINNPDYEVMNIRIEVRSGNDYSQIS